MPLRLARARYWSGRTKKGGAGLGLAIARGIVIAHDGRISVSSKPGEGARFEIVLPALPEHVAAPRG